MTHPDAGGLIGRRAWLLWAACALATVIVSLVTIRISPVAWQDEVQILDMGRTLLPGADESYAMSLSAEGRPVRGLPYLACIASELAYRLAGDDMAGPRLLAILGAVVASGTILGYVRARGIVPLIALAVSAAFLLDPMFAQGYRGGRYDGWSMAAMIGACWAIRANSAEGRIFLRGQLLAGALVAFAGLTWVSAIILLPLVAAEVHDASRQRSTAAGIAWVLTLVSIGIITFLTMFALSMPYAGSLSSMIGDTFGHAGAMASGRFELLGRLAWIAIPMAMTPLMPVLAVAALLWARQWALSGALIAALAAVLVTGPYGHRNVYLEPYMFVAIAVAAQAAWLSPGAWIRRFATTLPVLLVVWAAAVTLGARTVTALRDRAARDPDVPMTQLRAEVGAGDKIVYLSAWRGYYAARQLGWRYVRPFFETTESVRELLARSEVAVIDPGYAKEVATPELLAELGFRETLPANAPHDRPFRVYLRAVAMTPEAKPSGGS